MRAVSEHISDSRVQPPAHIVVVRWLVKGEAGRRQQLRGWEHMSMGVHAIGHAVTTPVKVVVRYQCVRACSHTLQARTSTGHSQLSSLPCIEDGGWSATEGLSRMSSTSYGTLSQAPC